MTKLLRKLSLIDSTFLVIGGVIGSGIFMTTGYIADYVRSPILILLVWAVGGLITLCGALSFGELGAMFPRAGGQYVYLQKAYGPWASFFYGWGFFWVISCGGIAALAVGFAEYLGYFFPAFSGQNALIQFSLGSLNYSLSAGQVIAVMAIILLSAINELGIKTGAFVQNIFTVMRLGGIAVFVALGIFWGNKIGVSTVSQLFEGSKSFRFDFFGLAIIAALWTYDGWYSVSCTAEEVKNPQRNIPLGLILGTLAVTLVYLTVNLLYIVALPLGRMRGVLRIGEVACAQLLGSQATSTFAAMVAVVIFGCLNANIIFCPRVCYALAEEGLFFRPMKSIHPRYRVPSKAIWGQAVWSSVLCLSGTYKGLFEYVIFALVIFFALTGLAVIILRRKNPEIPRPYRVWGYPAVPLLFVAINLAIFINALKSQPLKSLIGLGILLIGFPAYVYWRRKNIPAGNKNEGRSSEGCL